MQVSNFSSNLFLTAAAQNLLCLDLAAQAGVAVSSPWMTWFIAAAPPCILGMLLTPILMYKVCHAFNCHLPLDA
jgi:divalent anion:Na+ symporter, DASS family